MDSHHRDGRLVVGHLDSDVVQTVNGVAQRPSAHITDAVTVLDSETRSLHLVLVHRVDYRPKAAATVRNVVKLSAPCHAVFRTEKLQLGTPEHYRTHDDPSIRDPHDGTLTRDVTRWLPGATSADLQLSSSSEPWVFCGSHYRSNRDLRRLRDHFAAARRYTAATRILDLNAFGTWLGIDFALGLDKTSEVRPEGLEVLIDRLIQSNAVLDTVVHVHHGPVHYEDSSGRIATQEDWANTMSDPPRAWFTKKACFRVESEYRFAVSTVGAPVEPKHDIAVSPELRELTADLDGHS